MTTQIIAPLAVGLIVLIVGWRVTLAYQERTRRRNLIEGVAEAYLALDRNRVPLGVQGFITAGAARFDTTNDLLAARQIILDHGGHDPLTWARDELEEFEFLDFIKWQVTNGCTRQDYQNKEFFHQFVQRFRNPSGG